MCIRDRFAAVIAIDCGRSNFLELLRHRYIPMKRHGGTKIKREAPWLVINDLILIKVVNTSLEQKFDGNLLSSF